MNPPIDDANIEPIGGGDDDPFPSHVILRRCNDIIATAEKRRRRRGGRDGAAVSPSSEGTGPTWIDVSPISGGDDDDRDATRQTTTTTMRYCRTARPGDDAATRDPRVRCDGHRVDGRWKTTTMTTTGASKHESNGGGEGEGEGEGGGGSTRRRRRRRRRIPDDGRRRGGEGDAYEERRGGEGRRRRRRRGGRGGSKRRNGNLTWRMEPSLSLSDFTLHIVAIDDVDAVARFEREREEERRRRRTTRRKGGRTKERRGSKRQDKWMVEGLYLDMSRSGSEDDEDDDDGGGDGGGGGNDRSGIAGAGHVVRSNGLTGPYATANRTAATAAAAVVERYHLHRANLAVGPRRCGYFGRLFATRKYDDDDDDDIDDVREHTLEIPISCLPAVPAMLDYLYHHGGRGGGADCSDEDDAAGGVEGEVRATTATAVPLRYLARLLRNPSLFDSATSFLRGDIRPSTAVEYLKHAELFRQGKLADVCVRICAENFESLKITWFASLDPRLMDRILHSRYFAHPRASIDDGGGALCSKIASYIRCQSRQMDVAMLLSLTDARIMPTVCPEEALFFIRILLASGMDAEDLARDDDISSRGRCLYERCIDAAPAVVQCVIDSLRQDGSSCVPSGSHMRPNQRRNACNDYSRLPPQIKVDLLEYALAQQQIGEI